MIVITGAAGFIGSCLVKRLNTAGYGDLILVDDFSNEQKNKNLAGKRFSVQIHRDAFFEWLNNNHKQVRFIFHIGARTDTIESNYEILKNLNLDYSKALWGFCAAFDIPLIYASSAATYGRGEEGFDDDESELHLLKPLNHYATSKNEFDKWAVQQELKPKFWTGLKFFNVFGPNEYHKGPMASVIYHAFNQITQQGQVKLFQSHRNDVKDGEQKRDFVYVKDVLEVLLFFFAHTSVPPGIYNVGSGEARTFLDLAADTFTALDKKPAVIFVPTPESLREKYQYFTQAKLTKLFSVGYQKPFYTLEEGIDDYVKNYLVGGKYF
jgi:ADP-L-glycero-D-manno-heptose 6-epimerase